MHRQKTPGILVNVRMPLPKTQTIRFKYGRLLAASRQNNRAFSLSQRYFPGKGNVSREIFYAEGPRLKELGNGGLV